MGAGPVPFFGRSRRADRRWVVSGGLCSVIRWHSYRQGCEPQCREQSADPIPRSAGRSLAPSPWLGGLASRCGRPAAPAAGAEPLRPPRYPACLFKPAPSASATGPGGERVPWFGGATMAGRMVDGILPRHTTRSDEENSFTVFDGFLENLMR